MGKHRKVRDSEKKNGFWWKFVIATVVVLWLSLVVGNWLGHYLVEQGFLGGSIEKDKKIAEARPSYSPVNQKNKNQQVRPPVYSPKDHGTIVPLKTESPEPVEPAETPGEKITPTPTETRETPETIESPPPPPPESGSTETVAKPSKPVETSTPEKIAETPEKPVETTTPEPEKTEVPEPKKTVETLYTLQIGAFSKKENADDVYNQLKKKGYSVHLITIGQENQKIYKVHVGTFRDRESAKNQQAKLKNQGYEPIIIKK
ncbi:MAG: SPOR domain-containing protein [Candidatus Eremiobacteraeota bacterium]|nr:SPOR domain-containing protein [Candidatus Eremiobacteraeota bacterium]